MGPTVSENYEFVVGVDIHAATHTFALVDATTGAVLDQEVLSTSAAGLSQAQAWLTEKVGERAALIVVEGTGSFGAILTARLQAAGLPVVEAARMPRSDRRGTGKTTCSTRSGSPGRCSAWSWARCASRGSCPPSGRGS